MARKKLLAVPYQEHPDTEEEQSADNEETDVHICHFHLQLLRYEGSRNLALAVLHFRGRTQGNQFPLIEDCDTIRDSLRAAHVVRHDNQSRVTFLLLRQQ